MSRRQRKGRGGKDHHGCGRSGCMVCSPGRDVLGPTRQERAAEQDFLDALEAACPRCRAFGVGYMGCQCEGAKRIVEALRSLFVDAPSEE